MSATGYKIPDHLLVQMVRDETVILDPASGTYYTLDAIGTRVLQLYRETPDVDAAAAQIAAEYQVTRETARHDILALLEQMAAVGLAEAPDH